MSYTLEALGDPDAPICASGRRGYVDENAVAEALIAAQRQRGQETTAKTRETGVVETDYERCKACGWWHLVSPKRGNSPRTKRRRR